MSGRREPRRRPPLERVLFAMAGTVVLVGTVLRRFAGLESRCPQ
ncbi:MAG TPA: hypothetical protein VH459_03020 [Gaiellales bacterium]